MKVKKALTDSIRYRTFIAERDHALEKILYRYLSATHQVTDKLKEKVMLYLNHIYQHQLDFPTRQDLSGIDAKITPEFRLAAMRLSILFERLRKSTYLLSHVGEAEGIARAIGKVKNHYVPKEKLTDVLQKSTPSEGSIQDRVTLALDRLKRDVMDAVQTSLVRQDTLQDAMKRTEAVFPKVVTYQRPPKILKNRKMAEAEYRLGNKKSLSTGIFDEDQMEETTKDYLDEELPNDIFRRGPHDEMIFFDVKEQGDVEFTQRYEWELEQEITEDFVTQVREGSIDAANENGINDFIWVAIIDNKTDQCCTARDGKTSTEIESLLDEGKLDDDGECDAIVAPAHFNCRCKSVPMSEDIPDETPPDFGSFDDWLKEKAQG